MTVLYRMVLTWLRFTKAGQVVLFAFGLLFTYGGYFLWQVAAAFVSFFTLGSGAGHADACLLVEASFLLVHLAVVSWLFWRRVLYPTWWAWALNLAVPIGLFAHFVLLPWYGTPLDSAYQRYRFVRGSQRYQITLEKPGNGFDISVTEQNTSSNTTATSTSLLMGDYTVRHDTLFLQEWQGPRRCFIYHRTLVGFENSAVPIALTREPDIAPFSLRQRK
jgi:hypothetical protein